MGCTEQKNTAETDKFILGQSRIKPKNFNICQQLSSSKEEELKLRNSTPTSLYEKLKLPGWPRKACHSRIIENNILFFCYCLFVSSEGNLHLYTMAILHKHLKMQPRFSESQLTDNIKYLVNINHCNGLHMHNIKKYTVVLLFLKLSSQTN